MYYIYNHTTIQPYYDARGQFVFSENQIKDNKLRLKSNAYEQ